MSYGDFEALQDFIGEKCGLDEDVFEDVCVTSVYDCLGDRIAAPWVQAALWAPDGKAQDEKVRLAGVLCDIMGVDPPEVVRSLREKEAEHMNAARCRLRPLQDRAGQPRPDLRAREQPSEDQGRLPGLRLDRLRQRVRKER